MNILEITSREVRVWIKIINTMLYKESGNQQMVKVPNINMVVNNARQLLPFKPNLSFDAGDEVLPLAVW